MPIQIPTDSTPAGAANRALRLTFSYEGAKLTLVSQQSVEMVVPPSHAIDVSEVQSGFWFTVEDGQARTVYRRVMQSPIRSDVEVFSPEPDTSVHRRPVENPRGTFTLLVPEIAGSQTVALFDQPLVRTPSKRASAAKEIARFTIRKDE